VFKLQVMFYRSFMWVLEIAMKLIPLPKPTLFVGQGSALQLAQSITTMGSQRLLIVTDKVINELGMLEDIKKVCQQGGVNVEVYDGILPDPTFELIESGMNAARTHKSDAILAVGGGSSIDAAKMISVGLTNDKTLMQLTGMLKVSEPGLPLYVIPTTAGTGSEVTAAAVITDPSSGQKLSVIDGKLVPFSAALDPTLMTGLPAPITAATGIDALTHAIEAYVSCAATEETDSHARAATRLIFKHLATAYTDGGDLVAREALALGSCYAGLAFTNARVGYVHAVAHQLGAKYHVPHGLANALVLPYVLDFYGSSAHKRLAELALDIGIAPSNQAQQAQEFITRVKELIATLELPNTLKDIIDTDIPEMAQNALKEAHYLYPVPRYMDQTQCENLIKDLQG